MEPKTGLDKVKELMVSKKKVGRRKSDDPFLKMVEEFEKFIAKDRKVSPLRLKMFETKSGDFIVYQGSLQCVWVVLRKFRCYFYKTSLLRNVKSSKNSVLFKYFKKYKLTGGLE